MALQLGDDLKSSLQDAKGALQSRIAEIEGRHSRSRSRSPIPQIDPLRDLSPPKWTRHNDDEVDDDPPAPCAPGVSMSARAMPSAVNPMMGVMGGLGAMDPTMMGMGAMAAMGGMGGMSSMMGMNPMMGAMGGMNPMMGTMGGMNPMMGMSPMMGTMGGMNPMMGAMMNPMMGAMMNPMMGAMMNPMMGTMGDMMQRQQASMAGAQQKQDQAYKKAMAVIKAGAAPALPESETSTSSGGGGVSRNDSSSPTYRPPNTDPIPGVTDKRWDGYMRLFIEDDLHGYGFITCPELRKKYPEKFGKDIFVHRHQRNGFRQGSTVSFAVYLNYRGMPQATDLRKPGKTDEDD